MIFLFAARLAQLFLHQISAFAMAAADNGAPAAAQQALCASCTSFMMVNRGSHQCLKVAMDLNSQGVQVAHSKSEADHAQAVLKCTQSRGCASNGLNFHTDFSLLCVS